MISDRIREVQPPPLVELGQVAANQPGCISLGQGAPYYFPPPSIMNEFWENFSSNYHKYTQDPGLLDLRKQIVSKLHVDQKISVSPDQVVVTPGANQAFYNVLLTLTDPGDEIILFTPYYFNHQMACVSMNLVPVLVPLNPDFSMNLDLLSQSVSPKTKAIVIVNPGNPTGLVFAKSDLQAVIEIAQHYNLFIIADETYEYFVYSSLNHIPLATLDPSRVISLSSFSKTFGIPGWRLGYYTGPQEFISQSIKVQDTIGICAPHASQILGQLLLRHRNDIIPKFVSLMESNYSLVKDLVEEVSWLDLSSSGGAYYIFPKQNTSLRTDQLVRRLIRENMVYLVPGEGFGSFWSEYVRISFANVQEETLKIAFEYLGHFRI